MSSCIQASFSIFFFDNLLHILASAHSLIGLILKYANIQLVSKIKLQAPSIGSNIKKSLNHELLLKISLNEIKSQKSWKAFSAFLYNIKHERPSLTIFPNTDERVQSMTRSRVFFCCWYLIYLRHQN